jgi:apolipoprotein N-acyltransferase
MMLGGAALMAGAALPLAFAPFGYYPLAVIALSVVFWVWSAAPTWVAAAFYGWLFGVGMFGVGVSWVQVSIHQFGLPLYSFSVTVTALFVLGMALYPALVGGLGRLFPIRRGVSRQLVMFPALWAAGEILRGWLFTGFPWLLLGYSQVDSPLRVWSPVVGSYGTGFVVALLAGALIDLITTKAGGRRVAVATVGVLLLVYPLDRTGRAAAQCRVDSGGRTTRGEMAAGLSPAEY